jgi:hypothetical protein
LLEYGFSKEHGHVEGVFILSTETCSDSLRAKPTNLPFSGRIRLQTLAGRVDQKGRLCQIGGQIQETATLADDDFLAKDYGDSTLVGGFQVKLGMVKC